MVGPLYFLRLFCVWDKRFSNIGSGVFNVGGGTETSHNVGGGTESLIITSSKIDQQIAKRIKKIIS